MAKRLLLIDDDARLADMVGEFLQQSGYQITHAMTGAEGLNALTSNAVKVTPPFGLVILDLMLPDIDGLEVCKRIRALADDSRRLPILMLTAKGDPMDRVIGLELGADDYLPKPFEPRELLARIRAILRRRADSDSARMSSTSISEKATLQFGSLEINRDNRQATVNNTPCDLTSYQFDLLLALAERAGRVLTREQIMEAVRGRELEAFDRSIDVHMGRIRQAIELDPKDPKRILTVRGVGYVFAKQQI